eukprot:TRINITY_DN7828_c0_g1_i1.p1 TRINITY_DN7828_c0_g1~~TRINITY_DN7828_c0_g1_i1.p1  ORF type:complete len:347 (-),score=76.84 TRINITY_DN7828_c0_g1_i1:47-1087(-)
MKVEIYVAVVMMMMMGVVVGFGEPGSNGHPTWAEATNLVFVNAVRLDPQGYKSLYAKRFDTDISQMLVTYNETHPLFWDPSLGASSLFHSEDMAQHDCFQHDSCNGTDTFDRISSFYHCQEYASSGENIAAGASDPLDLNNMWICDGNDEGCAPDGNGDGHRDNIMSTGYQVIGIGYAYNSSNIFGSFATQDFGGIGCDPWNNSIYAGSHHTIESTISFLSIFYQGNETDKVGAPQTSQVVVEGRIYDMHLLLGTSSQGFYSYETTALADAVDCQHYYFSFVDFNGTTHRYPDVGFYMTYGQGNCDKYYSLNGPDTVTSIIPENSGATELVATLFTVLFAVAISML